MRPIRRGAAADGHGDVAGGAFHHHAGMALDFLVPHIVVGVDAGEFCVRRTVAGFALQTAVAGGKTEQRNAACGNIWLRGKNLVRGRAHGEICVGENGRVANLPVIAGRRAAVAARAIWFHEPADAIDGSDAAHIAVTTLALHGH